MRVAYTTLNEKDFLRSLQYSQHHPILSVGNGLGDITIFRKHRPLHRGTGPLTNIIFRYGSKLLPYLQKYLWPVAKEFGKNVAKDVMSGETSFKKSLRHRGKESLKDVGKRILRGGGRRKRTGRVKKRTPTKGVGRPKGKKRKGATRKKKVTTRGGTKRKRPASTKKGKMKVILRKKQVRSGTLKKLDCSRPKSRKLCQKDIFS